LEFDIQTPAAEAEPNFSASSARLKSCPDTKRTKLLLLDKAPINEEKCMAQKKQEESFTVTDRRLFTSEGELRKDVPVDEDAPKPAAVAAVVPQPAPAAQVAATVTDKSDGNAQQEIPPPPTAAEQDAQAAAYRQSSNDLDAQVELSGRSAKEFEMTFERFLASLYMTAMLQLGMMHEQGEQPRIDIIGARQTIDTLSLLAEKTKGNLTAQEENFLQNSLYEVRMAYVEVTNALARPPQAGAQSGTNTGSKTGTTGR